MPAWLEITNRSDLGTNLKAPQTDENGREYWSYSLINRVKHGDVVLHYHKPAQAIVAASRAVGKVWTESIVWGARGASARHAARKPRERPGWVIGLEHFRLIHPPVTLSDIRRMETAVREVHHRLATPDRDYFPLAISDKRPLRPAQGYLVRWPDELTTLFPSLETIARTQIFEQPKDQVGAEYRPADEDTAVSTREPFEVDPAIVERGVRGHALTQNALAEFLRQHGVAPRSPVSPEPPYDLAWLQEGVTYVAEVKSISALNEERQLRLGLGQVLRYSDLMRVSHGTVVGVLVVEREPNDPTWKVLCARLGIQLVWPGAFEALYQVSDQEFEYTWAKKPRRGP